MPTMARKNKINKNDFAVLEETDNGENESADDSDGMDFEDDNFDDDSDEESENVHNSSQENAPVKRKLPEGESKSKSAKKQKTSKEVKPPTAEELIHLRETENLYQSNLFRLQIEEMVKEVKTKKSDRRSVKLWINEFSNFLAELNDKFDQPLDDFSWLKKIGIKLPIPMRKNYKKGTFKFRKPAKVMPIGSVANGTVMGSEFTIDLAVVMPKKCFEKDDYLNSKYHLKRALYLCYLASKINKCDLIDKEKGVEFWTKTGDPLKPVLVCRPDGKMSSFAEIILTVIPEDGTFTKTRFNPMQNNLRPSWWGLDVETDKLPATPYYNQTILEDIVLEANEELKKSSFDNNQNVKDAALLMGVWLKQRELCQGFGSINMHIVNMLIVYLLKNQKINNNMSSYQIVRHIFNYLTQSDWLDNGPSLLKETNDEDVPQINTYHSVFPVVFMDSTGYFNLTFRVNKLTYMKLKSEATLAVQYLNDTNINSFHALFMTKLNFLLQYDHVISFTEPTTISSTVESAVDPIKTMDRTGHSLPLFCDLLGDLFLQGLGDRVKSVGINLLTTPRWSLNEKSSSSDLQDYVLFGLRLNSETALLLVEKGPQANLPEAAKFREFWGEKCELRRYRDSNVCESVVWGKSTDPLRNRRMIVSKIVSFLLEDKLKIKPNCFSYVADQFSEIITNKSCPSACNEESSQEAHKVYNSLTQQLRDLTDLPLSIVTVHCISPVFRFSDVFPPLPSKFYYCQKHRKNIAKKSKLGYLIQQDLDRCPPYVQPIELVLQMEMTQKWPDDIRAGKRLIAAFYIAIAASLKKQYQLETQVTPEFVRVQKDGYSFHLYLGYSKEIGLIKQRITAEGVKVYRDTKESIALEKKFINLPKLTGSLYGLSQIHSGYGGATCLAKRWIASHLLDEFHFPEIIIELLVAHLFLSPQPFVVSLQPLVGFLRFLNLLASTNWHTEPIIINFNNLLDREKYIEIEQLFNTKRDSLPPMFVATPYDTTGSLWTREAPTLPVLIRLAKIASTCYKMLELKLTSLNTSKQLMDIFTPPMSHYNLLIKLKESMISRRPQSVNWFPRKKPMGDQPITVLPIVKFNPGEIYLNELRENYNEFALFFYDPYGGVEIGVIFKPNYLKSIEFKTSHAYARKPIESKGNVSLEPDKEALIEGFRILGKNIVEDIIVQC